MLSQIDIFGIIKIYFFNVEKHDLKSICVKELQNCLQKLKQMFFLLHKNIQKKFVGKKHFTLERHAFLQLILSIFAR
jgi:hypothetical protein